MLLLLVLFLQSLIPLALIITPYPCTTARATSLATQRPDTVAADDTAFDAIWTTPTTWSSCFSDSTSDSSVFRSSNEHGPTNERSCLHSDPDGDMVTTEVSPLLFQATHQRISCSSC